ncbi:MAG: FprA family A-type flavoprotein [Prevotellaceae bacterium]|jgi:flavorubredoxin|nr:FprA family A-type flavoprotein [Prevotellaceae bacterium]
MYRPVHISDSIYYVGVNDRRTNLFESQLPLPYGVSYNSYIIMDEKIALIDTVDVCFFESYSKKIEAAIGDRKIDYLIVNHMEPDHSGSIHLIREHYPDIRIIGNAKTIEMINGYFEITNNLQEVKDGDQLELGKHRLSFTLTPMVHWPETMMTYDITEKALFSGDAFGCFGALDGGVIDQTMNLDKFWSEMRRYYANIVGKYGVPVQNALAKLQGVEMNYICSTHGPVWKEQIEKVVNLYSRWSRYEAEAGVVIAYGTMYGNTGQMAEAIAEGVVAGGVKNVILHDVSKTDASFILSDIFNYTGLVLGSPTYMNELFPGVESLLRKIEVRQVKNRVFASFGSFTWAGVAIKRIAPVIEGLKWDVVGSVEEKQALKQEKYNECFSLGMEIANKIKG